MSNVRVVMTFTQFVYIRSHLKPFMDKDKPRLSCAWTFTNARFRQSADSNLMMRILC